MLTTTLQELRDDVAFAADVPVGDNRITLARLDRIINDAVQAYSEKKSQFGLGDKVQVQLTGSTSAAAGPDGFPLNQTVTLPADFRRLTSVFRVEGQNRYPLEPKLAKDRSQYGDLLLLTNGAPTGYSLLNASSALSSCRLWVWPPSDAAYTYEVTYEPVAPTLVNVGDVFRYFPDTEDIVIARAALRILSRDGATQPNMIQMLQNDIAEAEQRLLEYANRDAGVLAMVDDSAVNRRRLWFEGV